MHIPPSCRDDRLDGPPQPDAGVCWPRLSATRQPQGVYSPPRGFIATPRLCPALWERGRMRAALAAWLVLSLLRGTGAGDTCGDPPAAPSYSAPAPQLSPEERLSPHMPESLRCDACHAIAFQVGTGDAAPQKRR